MTSLYRFRSRIVDREVDVASRYRVCAAGTAAAA